MSEKRKPEIVLFAEFPGKQDRKQRGFKVELFHVSQWKDQKPGTSWSPDSIGLLNADAYRLRVDGKWYKPSNSTPMTLSQVLALYRKTLSAFRGRDREKAKG